MSPHIRKTICKYCGKEFEYFEPRVQKYRVRKVCDECLGGKSPFRKKKRNEI